MLYVDHGSDFTSDHVAQVVVELHVELVRSTVARPQGRGKIERFFGSLTTELLPELPGHLVHGRSASAPRLTLPELDAAIGCWIIDTYHQRPHSETGLAPQHAWLADGWMPTASTAGSWACSSSACPASTSAYRATRSYSRIGFAHQYHPLTNDELAFVLTRHWKELGLTLDLDDFTDAQAVTAVDRITRGNFRRIHRLFTQIDRIMRINEMTVITSDIIEAARSTLVIGDT